MLRVLLACSARYWCQLAPQARSELTRWHRHARALSDAYLRGVALGKLDGEGLNSEGAAFIALLATNERDAVRRIVAFEVLYELLDGLTENQTLAECLRLHERLTAVVEASTPDCDSYSLALILAARTTSTPQLTHEITRICEAQSHNHAPNGQLQAWAQTQNTGLHWWETAAAGISSIGAQALLASPTEHHTTLTGAYLQVDALASLLDAVRDLPCDRATGNHNFAAHYESDAVTVNRLQMLARDADRAMRRLPSRAVHRMVLAGLLAYNLSAMNADLGLNDPLVRVGVFAMRLRRGVAGVAH